MVNQTAIVGGLVFIWLSFYLVDGWLSFYLVELNQIKT
jgi:hypothetical protein